MGPKLPEVRQLDFNRRVALRIRLATAMVFRATGLPSATAKALHKQDTVLETLEQASKFALSEAAPPIGDAIARAVRRLDDVTFDLAVPADRILEGRLQAFRNFLGTCDCPHCSTPDTGKHYPIDEKCKCVAEIYELFKLAEGVARSAYEDSSDAPGVAWPSVFLELDHLHQHQTTDVLDVAAVTGSCRYVDDPKGAVSVVGLIFRDHGFCWTTLGQLPYVLMHELICHAYQGLKGEDRVVVDKTCPWSEGWMDAIALAVTQDWIAGNCGIGLPVWAEDQKEKDFINLASQKVHERRRQPLSELDPLDLEARICAWDASFDLEKVRRGKNPDGTSARDFLRTFSFRLNLHAMTQEQRMEIADWIGLGLELGTRADEILNACSRFMDDGDWLFLYNRLKSLMK